MSIKKIKAQSPDPYVGKIVGDTEFARLAHLNNLVDQINNNSSTLPYKVYSALLTQSGTSAPVATVLENTIGSMVWSYSIYAPGAYEVVGTLPLGKSVVIAGPPNTNGPNTDTVLGTFSQLISDKIFIKSTNHLGVMQDGLLNNHFIEIRVYN